MKRLVYPLLAVVCAGMVACSTSETTAPIEDRSVSSAAARTVPAGPGYYTVMKGDTLYQISRIQGQRVSDLAAWNNLNNANEINEGQVLRVAPPGAEGVAVQTATVDDTGSEVQVITTSSSVETKTGPSGEKQAYSESAIAGGGAATAGMGSGASREVSGITWAWPATGKVLRGFSEGQSKGIDIEGKQGQKVLAAAEGRVIYSGTMNGYGNLVIIKHTDDLLTAYAHNSNNLVTQGSSVSKGQQIAEMGNSGTDTVKLHFEVRRQGKPVDPLGYLPQQ